ncbi:MAG: glycosyltransferase [Thermodesulfobacteriota bacterium]|nr:glycosyltransferase [Thermodesulfobacteriota bacterium]
MENNHKIAIFASFSGQGGVERIILNLAEGLSAKGCNVDLILAKKDSPHLKKTQASFNLIDFGKKHTFSCIPALVRYLKQNQPTAMLAAKDRANQAVIMARFIAGVQTRIVVRMGTTVSAAIKRKNILSRLTWYIPMRILYPKADSIIAVSHGVANDMKKITRVSGEKMEIVPNPVITDNMMHLSHENVNHPWFADHNLPIIIGSGRLTRQKDFPTLIKAFAEVNREFPSRLVILGDGKDRASLLSLADELEISENIYMPGFVANPYAYISKADLFVLSSIWEGSPNVLTEALALGIPVVSTDCPSGPREILSKGKYGELVPMGDTISLSKAILRTLKKTRPSKESMLKAVSEYTIEASTSRYYEILTR